LFTNSKLITLGNFDLKTDTVWQDLAIKNTGSGPLIIEDVQVSCGCLVVEKPEKAIAPGQISEIPVAFVLASLELNAHEQLQQFTRKVVIRSNTKEFIHKIDIVGAVDKGDLALR